MKAQAASFIFGGLLPIIAFTVIEDQYGPFWGLVAAMVFGVGELIFEKVKYKKVSTVTWIGNGLVIGLGVVSIFTQDGFWFKMQPALLEAGFAMALWVTQIMDKPMLVEMTKKQNPGIPEDFLKFLAGVNWRTGIFFMIHAGIAVWAALKWSTQAWAMLKGLGVTLSFIVYLVVEVFVFRLRVKSKL